MAKVPAETLYQGDNSAKNEEKFQPTKRRQTLFNSTFISVSYRSSSTSLFSYIQSEVVHDDCPLSFN